MDAKHCYLRGLSVAKRHDYTYTPGIGGHKLHLATLEWNEARLACEEEGAHLAIINSIVESKAIADLLEKSPAPPETSQPDCAHIGFHDLYKEGQFITIHGQSIEKAGFTDWASREPYNYEGNEHCGAVYKDGPLNDVRCGAQARFICEIPMPSV